MSRSAAARLLASSPLPFVSSLRHEHRLRPCLLLLPIYHTKASFSKTPCKPPASATGGCQEHAGHGCTLLQEITKIVAPAANDAALHPGSNFRVLPDDPEDVRCSGDCDQDLTSSSHSSTKVADPSVQSENTSIAYKGPLTRARARELQTKVNLFLSTLNYEINENNLLPNGCTLLVLNYEGITSLEEKERVAGSNLCLTAHVHDDGIMREEREAGSSCSSILQWRGRLYFGIQDDHMSIQTCREKIERFEFVSDSVRFIQTDSEEK
ncbi:hypothetical protein EJB05_15593, partial [Eragrostis curvula]